MPRRRQFQTKKAAFVDKDTTTTTTSRRQQLSSSTKQLAPAAAHTTRRPLCRFFVLHGNCRYGDDCAYSHTLPPGGVTVARQQIACPYFAQPGTTCKYGDLCQLRHDSQDLASWSTAATTTTTTTPPPTTTLCGICLENPADHQKKFGLLSGCSHVFCFACLMEWRKKKGCSRLSLTQEQRRNCPTCRTHSDYVVPSDRYWPGGPEKQAIIAAYKARLALIPCKNFDGTLGSCVFGRDCFFAHLQNDDSNNNNNSSSSGPRDIKSQDESMEVLLAKRKHQRAQQQQQQQDDGYDDDDDDMEALSDFLLLLDLYASRGYDDGLSERGGGAAHHQYFELDDDAFFEDWADVLGVDDYDSDY